jgi:putative ABC transport system permease protein
MMVFLIKGLLRDKSRSRLPVIVVTLGVMLTVWLHAYINGFMGETIEMNARFSNGHVKVMTRAYAEDMDLMPLDLALLDVPGLLQILGDRFPEMTWSARIPFGGLADVPDREGETRAQGPVMGLGLDLMTPGSPEAGRLNMAQALVRGRMPEAAGEVLLSEQFACRLGIHPGESFTLIGSSMNHSMVMHNFILAGTLEFGVEAMDRGTLVADLEDVRLALDMEDAASEILGFFPDGFYNHARAIRMSEEFNVLFENDGDGFAPMMKSLSQQGTMGTYVELSETWAVYISMVFVLAMALVLWNAGLLGGLRRYGEVGVRLAMGEEKGHIYRTMIYESAAIGLTGSLLGTALGVFFAWLVQVYGINIEGMMEGAALMMPSVIRTRITPPDFYIGFIPGLLSTVAGTMLSGIGIYKRQTARLFKELEA